MALIEISDDEVEVRFDSSSDSCLAIQLQRAEYESSSCSNLLTFSKHDHVNSDEALALQLQREEELVLEATTRSVVSRKRPFEELHSSIPPKREHIVAMVPESQPICADPVAMIRDCLSGAGDVSRSEAYLCGRTPFYHQHKKCAQLPAQPIAAAFGEQVDLGSIDLGASSDNWSCGYRNAQMLIGHLIAGGRSDLFGGCVPNIPSLQAELERLWALGYDPEGCCQLGGRVYGSSKWIGTSEACVLLRGQSIRCNIVSFRGAQDQGDPVASAAGAVVEWALRHFREGSIASGVSSTGVVVSSSRPPLYLQHDGHSRTVVGVQRRCESRGIFTDFLLVLDPGLGEKGVYDFVAGVSRKKGWEKFVKRSLTPLGKKSEYEILVVEPQGSIGSDMVEAAKCIARKV